MSLAVSDFRLPEQLPEYRAALARFIAQEGRALAEETEQARALPSRLFPVLARAGLLGLTFPREFGGAGLSPTQYAPLLEEVAHASGAIRLVVHMSNWVSSGAIVRDGTDEQRRRHLPALAAGEGFIAFALTEPDTGTGTDIRTSARRGDGTYYLSGRKHLVSYANVARCTQVVAYTDRARRGDGISLFLVDHDSPAMTITEQPDGMGLHGSFHG